MNRRNLIAWSTMLIVLAGLALALAGPVLAASRTVAIENFDFVPDPIRIRLGDSVRWRNDDPVPHTATARNGSWDTGLFLGGQTSGPITFTAAGTYPYFCATHPEMVGRVIVSAGTVPHTDTAPIPDATSPNWPAAVVMAVASAAMGAWLFWRQPRRRGDRTEPDH